MTTHEHGGDVFAIARQMGVRPEELLDFSASINPLGMPASVRRAVAEEIGRLVHYPDADAGPLREALAGYHGVSPDQVCPANGSTELIYLLPRLVAGRRALIVSPAFSEYSKALAISGWQVEPLELAAADGFALSLPELDRRLAVGVQLVFLGNPANPTGRLYSASEVGKVADCCARHGALLVLDEAFIDFCGEEHSMARCLSQAGTAIVLRSLTKFYAIPGLRLGYAVASQALCARLATLRGPWSVNSLAQAAGCAAMTDAGFRERSQWLVARERERLFRRISLIPLLQPFPGAANYLLVRLRDGGEAEGLRMALLQRRIVIRNCANFAGLDGSFFRIAVRRPRQNDLLVHHMAAIIGKNKLIK